MGGLTFAKKKEVLASILLILNVANCSFFLEEESHCLSFVGDGQFFSAFSAACGQNFSAICRGHSLTETVLICSFSA